MANMEKIPLEEEAEICRRRAIAYLGWPEATFLLRVAKEFDRLSQRNVPFLARAA
jgi:hypothetical protein